MYSPHGCLGGGWARGESDPGDRGGPEDVPRGEGRDMKRHGSDPPCGPIVCVSPPGNSDSTEHTGAPGVDFLL